jgi:ABC-type multidrug transport system ATPase subunit
VVLVTHRVAAASRCDRVIVLDQGKVIEDGTHEELIANGGLYSRFAEEQAVARDLESLAKADLENLAARAPLDEPLPPAPLLCGEGSSDRDRASAEGQSS